MGAAPTEHSGVASAVNNVVARAASLFAVSVLPLVAGLTGAAALDPQELAAGFRTAMLISAVTCALGGVMAALTIRNPVRPPAPAPGHVPDLVVWGQRTACGRGRRLAGAARGARRTESACAAGGGRPR